MSLFGACTFAAVLSPPRLVMRLQYSLSKISLVGALIGMLSCVGWLMLEAGEMGEGWQDAVDPAMISSVLRETAFGSVWIVRLGVGLILIAVLALIPAQWRIAAAFSGVFLASLGFIDHAAMHQGVLGGFERLNQATHMICAGFWVGSLLPLLLCLSLLKIPVLKNDASTALRRFSGIGHFAVAGVILTGVTNTLVILGRWPTDFSSPYQLLLFVKIAFVATMTILAIVNRYYFVPRFARFPNESMRGLSISTLGEIVLGAAALGSVSAFAMLEPK
jgi:putative copper resistance protein D